MLVPPHGSKPASFYLSGNAPGASFLVCVGLKPTNTPLPGTPASLLVDISSAIFFSLPADARGANLYSVMIPQTNKRIVMQALSSPGGQLRASNALEF